MIQVVHTYSMYLTLRSSVNDSFDVLGGLQILIDASNSERAGIARRLIELHFKQQFKLMQSEAR